MDYALAKELKDAGFPQGPKTKDHHGNGGWFDSDGDHMWHGTAPEFVYAPVLHELIEACGEITLLVGKEKSVAMNNRNPLESDKRGDGATPEIAVARLWLALNKKA